jgi:hypothetical protein
LGFYIFKAPDAGAAFLEGKRVIEGLADESVRPFSTTFAALFLLLGHLGSRGFSDTFSLLLSLGLPFVGRALDRARDGAHRCRKELARLCVREEGKDKLCCGEPRVW